MLRPARGLAVIEVEQGLNQAGGTGLATREHVQGQKSEA